MRHWKSSSRDMGLNNKKIMIEISLYYKEREEEEEGNKKLEIIE